MAMASAQLRKYRVCGYWARAVAMAAVSEQEPVHRNGRGCAEEWRARVVEVEAKRLILGPKPRPEHRAITGGLGVIEAPAPGRSMPSA